MIEDGINTKEYKMYLIVTLMTLPAMKPSTPNPTPKIADHIS
jgi:hypothetical protein